MKTQNEPRDVGRRSILGGAAAAVAATALAGTASHAAPARAQVSASAGAGRFRPHGARLVISVSMRRLRWGLHRRGYPVTLVGGRNSALGHFSSHLGRQSTNPPPLGLQRDNFRVSNAP